MFVLVGVKDTVPVEAKAFTNPDVPTGHTIRQETAITDALNKKYANKLIMDKGLALCVFDILTAEDGRVTWGNGLMFYKVSLRLMLFAPFIGEVIAGHVVNTTRNYIRVSLGFYSDVYITPNLLPPNSAYDPKEEKFFYWADADEGEVMTPQQLLNTVKNDRLYIDNGEAIRFRVSEIDWQPKKPRPEVPEWKLELEEEDPDAEKIDPIDEAGFRIMGTIAESGLGIVSWWAEGGGEEVMEEG